MSDENYVDTPPAGAEGWREVWEGDRRYPPRPARHEWFFRIVRKIVRRAIEPDAERQKSYNLVLLDLLGGLRGDIAAVRRDLRGDLEDINRDLAAAIERRADLIITGAKRNDALIAALDQKIETLAVRLRDAINPAIATAPDVVYRRLEDALRGSESAVRADVAHYVAIAEAHQPAMDVGCGRGEFLAACRERGIDASGVDLNERSVADLVQRGFRVSRAGIPECFSSLADGSIGSILAMHVVEHLPVEALFALFREAARVLRSEGMLMIETPNAESILMAASDFWRDPTHLAPRHPAALTVLAREHGFEIAEIRAVHELPEGTRIAMMPSDPPELQRVVHAINDRLFAPQDLRLVLRKP